MGAEVGLLFVARAGVNKGRAIKGWDRMEVQTTWAGFQEVTVVGQHGDGQSLV